MDFSACEHDFLVIQTRGQKKKKTRSATSTHHVLGTNFDFRKTCESRIWSILGVLFILLIKRNLANKNHPTDEYGW